MHAKLTHTSFLTTIKVEHCYAEKADYLYNDEVFASSLPLSAVPVKDSVALPIRIRSVPNNNNFYNVLSVCLKRIKKIISLVCQLL